MPPPTNYRHCFLEQNRSYLAEFERTEGAGNVDQLVNGLSRVHEGLGSIPSTAEKHGANLSCHHLEGRGRKSRDSRSSLDTE